jgi:hypothetical protein
MLSGRSILAALLCTMTEPRTDISGDAAFKAADVLAAAMPTRPAEAEAERV